MSMEKVLEIAQSWVGYLEKASNKDLDSKTSNVGSSNWTIFGQWYGLNPAEWCDMFVSYCADKGGEAAAVGKFAYCPSHVNFFKSRGQWFNRGDRTPQAGDIIFFGDADHVGLVESVSGGYVNTIEGNTRSGNTLVANGGGVYRKSYPLTSSYIMGYGRPNYSSVSEKKTGWQKDEIGWWWRDEDGSYPRNVWRKIDGYWYFFDESGYILQNTSWTFGNTLYVADAEGHVTSVEKEDNSVKEIHYNLLKELPDMYRAPIDNLIAAGFLNGREGAGDDLVLDMNEDSVRCLVIMSRAFEKAGIL